MNNTPDIQGTSAGNYKLFSKPRNRWILGAVSLAIVAVFFYYIYENLDKYKELLSVSTSGVIGIFIIALTFPFLNGMQNIYLYRSLGAFLSYREGFSLTAASTLANQLPVSGGIISKAVYLKIKHNLSYAKFASTTLALYLCFVSVNGITGLAALVAWKDTLAAPPVLIAAYILMSMSFAILWMPLGRIRLPKKVNNWLLQAVQGWALVGWNLGLLIRLVSLQIILVFLLSCRYYIAFHMLSQNVSLGQTLIFASATILTQIVGIAPGGLGVRELIVGAVGAALGFNPGVGVVAVGMDRLVSTVAIALTGWLGTVLLGKQLSQSAAEKEQPSDG